MPSTEPAGAKHALLGKLDRRVARGLLAGPRLLEHGLHVGGDARLDRFQGLSLVASGILHRSTDHTAGVGDEIGNDENSPLVQNLLRLGSERNVRALEYEPRSESIHLVDGNDVRARGRNPDLAFRVEDRIAPARLSPGVLGDAATRSLQFIERWEGEAAGIQRRAARV